MKIGNILTKICVTVLIGIIGISGTQANEESEIIEIPSEVEERLVLLEETLENYSVTFRNNIPLGSPFVIDLGQLQEIAAEGFSDVDLRFQWQVDGDIIEDVSLNVLFEEAGNKDISLDVFGEIDGFERMVYKLSLELFVFSETMAFVIEESKRNNFETFQNQARSRGILIQEFGFFREDQLRDVNFGELYREYRSRFPVSSDYVTVLGTKEFAITFLRHGNIENSIENIVIVNSYNRTLFREYFRNSFIDDQIMWNSFLVSDIYIDQLLRYPIGYHDLRQSLIQNGYSILDLNFDMRSHPLFFISSQIQYLGRYFTQSELYILLLIPFFITAVSIFKHLIGLNTLGIIIPVFLTYLMIDIGIGEVLILFLLLGVVNILIAQYLNRYALLYTPKISFLIVVNILLYLLIGHIIQYSGIWEISFYSLMSFIFFIIIAERFLVVVTSKELLEYKSAITGTIILSVLLAGVSYVDVVRIVLFSYPEILIFLLPINFYLAQFTGLRFTEYLRFKEVMKDIEE